MSFHERKQVVIFVVAGAMVAVFVLLWYRNMYSKVHQTSQDKVSQQAAIDKAEAEISQLPELKQKLMDMEQAVGDFETRVPGDRALGVFLQQMAEMMNNRKLTDHSIQPGQEILSENLIGIPVTIQCKGKLKQIFEFFQDLEKLDRTVRIEQVKLTNETDLSGSLEMYARAMVFYKPSQKL